VEQHFGQFQSSGRRPALFKKLVHMVHELSSHSFIRDVIVDGSFVTAKDRPEDIDLIVVVDPEVYDRVEQGTVNAYEYSALSSQHYRRTYSFDVFVVPEGSAAYGSYLTLFSRVKDQETLTKGVVRLQDAK
jgi:hypothetical protein